MKLIHMDQESRIIEANIDVFKASHSSILNKQNFLEFATTSKNFRMFDRVIYKDDLEKYNEFVVRGIEDTRESSNVYAEHSSYDLKSFIIKDKRPEGLPSAHLLTILDGTNWEVGTVDGIEPISNNYYYISAFDAIRSLADKAKLEISYDIVVVGGYIINRKVNLRNKIGTDRGIRFTYSRDLVGVTRNTLENDFYTAIIGRGKGEEIGDGYGRRINFGDIDKPDSPLGVEYVENVVTKELYGVIKNGVRQHRIGVLEFDDIEDKEELYLKTKEELDKYTAPAIEYTADVVYLESDGQIIELGDSISIIDKDYFGENDSLRLIGRVIEIKKDLINKTNTTIKFGTLTEPLGAKVNKNDKYINSYRSKASIWDRSSVFQSDNTLPASYITFLLDEWNKQANTSGGYTYTLEGQGTVTYDRPIDDDPTQVVQIVGGTVRIADSKKLDGSWDWRTVINASGIAGEEIIAQSITANQLRSDAGSNLDLSSNESIRLTVKESIDDIDVGGRNLLLNSNEVVSLHGEQKTYEITRLLPETQYTVSISGTYNSPVEVWLTILNMGENGIIETEVNQNNAVYIGNLEYNKLTFTAQGLHTALVIRTLGDLELTTIQLEKGTLATDWTPAPEEQERRLSSVEQTAESTKTTLTDLKNDFESSMRYGIKTIDGEDHGVLELGELNSPFKLWLWNKRISFIQDGKTVAYIDNKKLYITDGEFLTSLRVGNFEFKPRTNGNLSFGKVV